MIAHPDKALDRASIAKTVTAFGKDGGYTYVVRWDGVDADATTLTSVGRAFTAPTLTGERYEFGEVLGKRPAIVTFWASWCAPCLKEAPHIEALFAAHKARGLEVVSVSIDTDADRKKLQQTVKSLGITYPVVLDPSGRVLAEWAKESSIPLTFVLDAAGKVVHQQQNFEKGDEVRLRVVASEVVEAHKAR